MVGAGLHGEENGNFMIKKLDFFLNGLTLLIGKINFQIRLKENIGIKSLK